MTSDRESIVGRYRYSIIVKGGIVPKESAAIYNLLFDKRQVSDYADLIRFERRDVEHMIPEVEEFVQCMHLTLGISPDA